MEPTPKSIMFNILLKLTAAFGGIDVVHEDEFTETYTSEMYCLALNTYFEARGESFEAKVAIAQTVMHRKNDKTGEFKRHNNICNIVKYASQRTQTGKPLLYKCWYSWYCDGKPNEVQLYTKEGKLNILEKRAWEESVQASFYAYHNLHPDIVKGSTHYYNDSIANPYWSDSYDRIVKHDSHVFLK